MRPKEMADAVRADGPESAIKAILLSASVAACKSREEYAAFKHLAKAELRTASEVFIAGSGNWGFSLDPQNLLRPFGDHSDIDLAAVDEGSFLRIWGELRQFHRESFYRLSLGCATCCGEMARTFTLDLFHPCGFRTVGIRVEGVS